MPTPFTCSIQTPILNAPAAATTFCMEGFIWWPSGAGASDTLSWSVTGGGTIDVTLGNSSQLTGIISSPAGSFSTTPYTYVLTDQWAHVALTHDGTTLRMFVAGNVVASLVCAFSIIAAITLARLSPNGTQTQTVVPFADECRCIIGQAVYVGTFTPPVAPFTLPFVP